MKSEGNRPLSRGSDSKRASKPAGAGQWRAEPRVPHVPEPTETIIPQLITQTPSCMRIAASSTAVPARRPLPSAASVFPDPLKLDLQPAQAQEHRKPRPMHGKDHRHPLPLLHGRAIQDSINKSAGMGVAMALAGTAIRAWQGGGLAAGALPAIAMPDKRRQPGLTFRTPRISQVQRR